MDRCAVFVDAGYLFAQGSAALSGSKKRRTELQLNPDAVIVELFKVVAEKAPGCQVLRVYWYDGAPAGNRPTTDHALLAGLDNVKLRLGFLNQNGQQKGVDSLIVTDLIELARLKSISDALLLSGDEDVRIGVQIAQSYGVRVHLLGIAPSRGSQSRQLMQEADTTAEWDAATIGTFLSVWTSSDLPGFDPATPSQPRAAEEAIPSPAAADVTRADEPAEALIDSTVQAFVQNLDESDVAGIVAFWETNRGVPPDVDRKLLPTCRAALGRNLEKVECRQMRLVFQAAVNARSSKPT